MSLTIIQNAVALFAAPKIVQQTVILILIAATLIVLALLFLILFFALRTERPLDTTERPLDYGHFFLVIFGILAALIGFLVAFPLLVSGARAGVLIIALITTIIGLVGTFFGILRPYTGIHGTSITGTVRRSKDLLVEHYTLVVSLLYIYSTGIGILYSYFLYRQFRIHILDHSEIGDFLFAALKNPLVFVFVAGQAFFLFLVVAFYDQAVRSSNQQRSQLADQVNQVRASSDGVPGEDGEDLQDTFADQSRDFHKKLLGWSVGAAIVITLSILGGSFWFPYDAAVDTAQAIKQGKHQSVVVRHSSSSGSTDLVPEHRLEFIGANQNVAFLYDRQDERTLVIPQSQIVSIEVPEQD